MPESRRVFLWSAAGAGALFTGAAALGAGRTSGRSGNGGEEGEADVTPAEDLMREHGVLKRVLLVYDEVRERIGAGKPFAAGTVARSAEIVRSFIEQYHEKLEEDHLFPRFRKKGKLVDLVDTLEAQHEAGRRLTDGILGLSKAGLETDGERQRLAGVLHEFVRMYAPHEAREDTVLFPAIRQVVSEQEYDELGDQFEKKEHELFGKEGFEGMVDRVAVIEKELGIYDLSRFTPR
ncbi:MAG: hemerythrin domain-containing protein [Candidatus Eisenbacteria bacterium]|nr:hemerythrin domain-containing protein [Candidatus Eisenbacteria bacterium]